MRVRCRRRTSIWTTSTRAGSVSARRALECLWSVRFESVRPERRFPAFRGPGQPVRLALVSDVWRACGYESWLDRDRLMLLDCDRW